MEVHDIKIYVATTNVVNIKLNNIYEIVQCGDGIDLGYTRDNTLDNISEKNPYYSELTLLYWIWKNKNDSITGLNHYHRYFYKNLEIINNKDINHIMNSKDIIIPKKLILKDTVSNQYSISHIPLDYIKCRDVVGELSPEYISSFDKVSSQYVLHPYNMFITNKDILDQYCSFLFPILSELENRIDTRYYDYYQKRVFGFLAERLFTTWIDKNNSLSIEELNVFINKDSIIKQKIKNIVTTPIKNIINNK